MLQEKTRVCGRNRFSHCSVAAELLVWFWPPDAQAMELRHYDTVAHGLDAVYEDVQPGFSTATGVARTSERTLFPTGGVPVPALTARSAWF